MTRSTQLASRERRAHGNASRAYVFHTLTSVAGVVAGAIVGLTAGALFGVFGPPGSWTGAWLGPLGRSISEGPRSLADLYEQPRRSSR
jgi:hypothetical protein